MPVSAYAEEVLADLDGIKVDALRNDRDSRFAVINAARRVLASLETPFERCWRLAWIDANVSAAIQVLIDIGLWEGWLQSDKDEATLEELLDMCHKPCDLMLLRRLLRLLAAELVVEEAGPDQYRATPFTKQLGVTSEPVAQTIVSGTLHGESCRNLPAFLARTQYEEPVDPRNTCYMDLTAERAPLFARCAASPAHQASFIGFMRGITAYKLDWTDVYDTAQLLAGDHGKPERALLVDVGGASGVDVARLLRKLPADKVAPGRLVLQDLPEVVGLARVDAKITAMPHDFFTPQPVEGARAYFMHSILHDWDDRDARRILGRLAAAMDRAYSRLLLYETCMPEAGASIYQAVADVSLMHLISAAERTEKRWSWLLQSAGFEIVKVWSHPSSIESVIEARLV
ncbi:putative O-methyltransferase [Xylariomycetidae sp. FL0641]|nr:putative O-methyltransferase [Xylariomycetidae sp. FL0641]